MPAVTSPPQQELSFTIRQPPYSYLHLSLVTPPSLSSSAPSVLDEVTLRQYLTAALTQYLGLTGSAISIDILKVEGAESWVRVPFDEAGAVVAALSQWVGGRGGIGLRVVGKGSWLGGLAGEVIQKGLWNLGE